MRFPYFFRGWDEGVKPLNRDSQSIPIESEECNENEKYSFLQLTKILVMFEKKNLDRS
jgi:hypothetical protein